MPDLIPTLLFPSNIHQSGTLMRLFFTFTFIVIVIVIVIVMVLMTVIVVTVMMMIMMMIMIQTFIRTANRCVFSLGLPS